MKGLCSLCARGGNPAIEKLRPDTALLEAREKIHMEVRGVEPGNGGRRRCRRGSCAPALRSWRQSCRSGCSYDYHPGCSFGGLPSMRFAFAPGLRAGFGAVSALAVSVCLAFPTWAQDEIRDQGGISSPLLSRCAGKFGAQLRAGDEAFPLLSLMGEPWMKIERTDQRADGAHVVAIVTGIGARARRRGQIVGLQLPLPDRRQGRGGELHREQPDARAPRGLAVGHAGARHGLLHPENPAAEGRRAARAALRPGDGSAGTC